MTRLRRLLCWLNPWGHLWHAGARGDFADLRCRRCGEPYDRIKHCRAVAR